MSEEKITITKSDLDFILDMERIKERQKLYEERFNKHIDNTEPMLRDILSEIQSHPHTLLQCKNELWKEVEDEFLTKTEAEAMEERIESKVSEIKNKLTWTLSIIIFLATIGSQFIMYYVTNIKGA